MKFNSLAESKDEGRSKRLAFGAAGSIAILALLLTLAAVFGSRISKQVAELEVDVKLVQRDSKPPPPPPPPPPPKVARQTASVRDNKPAALGNTEAPPKEIPKDLPKSGDTNRPEASIEHQDGVGSPDGVRGGTGRGGTQATPPPAAVATTTASPPQPPAPALQELEQTTAPRLIRKVLPKYPDEAKQQGIESVVEVTFFVAADGSVEDLRILHGHPLFASAVREALLAWRFEPGTIGGKPARMRRQMKLPFRLRTQ